MAKINKKPVKIPVHGKAAHNTAFLTAIGGLIVNWANNESVFLGMLQALLRGGSLSAAIAWHSHRTSVAKIELVMRLCREQVKDQDLLVDLLKAGERFKNLSRARNFFCHATYRYDSNLCLASAQGATSQQEGPPLAFENKPMNRATLNEIGRTSVELGELNAALWQLVFRLHKVLGVPLPDPPSPLAVQKSNQGVQSRLDADGTHEEQPSPSRQKS